MEKFYCLSLHKGGKGYVSDGATINLGTKNDAGILTIAEILWGSCDRSWERLFIVKWTWYENAWKYYDPDISRARDVKKWMLKVTQKCFCYLIYWLELSNRMSLELFKYMKYSLVQMS